MTIRAVQFLMLWCALFVNASCGQTPDETGQGIDEVVQADKRYQDYVEQFTSADAEELLAHLAANGELRSRLAEGTSAADDAEFAWISGVEFVQGARGSVTALENPFTEQLLQDAVRNQREDQIAKELAGLREGQLPAVPKSSFVAKDNAAPDAAADETLVETARRVRQRVLEERSFAKKLAGYFDMLNQAREDFQDVLEHRQTAYAQYSSALENSFDLALKQLACIREIEKRVELGQVTADQTPEGVTEKSALEVVREIVARKKTLDANQQKAQIEDARLKNGVELTLAWKAWSEIFNTNVEAKAPLVQKAVSRLDAALLTHEKLSEYDRKLLEFRAQASQPLGSMNRILVMLLNSETRARFEEGLGFYQVEYEDANRRIDEYTAALKAYEELIEASIALGEGLAGSVEDLIEPLSWRENEYTMTRYMAAISAHPEWQGKYVAAHAKLGDTEFLLPLDEQAGDVNYWINKMLLAEIRWQGQQRWMDDFKFRQSSLGVSSDVSSLREQATLIEANLADTQGRAENVSDSINTLQSDYESRIQSNAVGNLVQLLTIPLIALLLSFVVRRFASRLERSGEENSSADSERARRMATLVRTGSSAINTLIWFLALIYMLKLMGLDITPILASASIFGLAVAFASQSLIKDFFTGFVMLWENQFGVGDFLDVGGVTGNVERITMRMTVLRDNQGKVHYIPNGSISQVSNHMKGYAAHVLHVKFRYNVDVDQATEILNEVLSEALEDPEWGPRIIQDESSPVVLGVMSLDMASMEIGIRIKTKPGDQWSVARQIRRLIKKRFDRDGISISTKS